MNIYDRIAGKSLLSSVCIACDTSFSNRPDASTINLTNILLFFFTESWCCNVESRPRIVQNKQATGGLYHNQWRINKRVKKWEFYTRVQSSACAFDGSATKMSENTATVTIHATVQY